MCNVHFYRATPCVIKKRVLYCRRCSSCHVRVNCIQMAEDIVKLLSLPGSPTIVVFLTPCSGTQFQGEGPGNSFQHGIKYTGVHGKNLRFSTEIAVYLGNIYNTRDTQFQTMLYGTFIGIRKSYRWKIDPCRFR